MNNPVASSSYLARALELSKSGDKASLIYAALELRCGVEARLQEHASAANGLTKQQAGQWEIKKLARTLEQLSGLGDSMLMVFVTMRDGRTCNFLYAPVSARLQEIAKRCGDYLHALRPERVSKPEFWDEIRLMIKEGCGLLEIACSSEILCPMKGHGFHFELRSDDPRNSIVRDLQAGGSGRVFSAKLTPAGPMNFLPANQ